MQVIDCSSYNDSLIFILGIDSRHCSVPGALAALRTEVRLQQRQQVPNCCNDDWRAAEVVEALEVEAELFWLPRQTGVPILVATAGSWYRPLILKPILEL